MPVSGNVFAWIKRGWPASWRGEFHLHRDFGPTARQGAVGHVYRPGQVADRVWGNDGVCELDYYYRVVLAPTKYSLQEKGETN